MDTSVVRRITRPKKEGEEEAAETAQVSDWRILSEETISLLLE